MTESSSQLEEHFGSRGVDGVGALESTRNSRPISWGGLDLASEGRPPKHQLPRTELQ